MAGRPARPARRRRPSARRRSGSTNRSGAARSTTGPGRSSWRPRSTATSWPPRRTSSRRPSAATPGSRWPRSSGSTPTRPGRCPTRSSTTKPYVVLTRGLEDTTAERIRAAIADGTLKGISHRARVGPDLPAGGRRGRDHPGGPPARVRQPRRRGPVRRRGALPGRARRDAARAARRARRRRSADHRHRPGPEPGRRRDGSAPDDRHRPPAGRRAGGPGRLHRRRGGQRVGRRDGPGQRGDLRRSASYPSYDANDYRTVASEDPKAFIDPVVSSVYEPGSVFKMFTALAALEKGTINLSTRILDSGSLSLDHGAGPDLRRRQARQRLHGSARHRGLLAERRGGPDRPGPGQDHGPGVEDPGRRLAPARVRPEDRASTWPARRPGLVRDPALKRWSQVDLANGSFGQGVAVTQLQLVTGLRRLDQRRDARHARTSSSASATATSSRRNRGQVMSPGMSKTMVDLMSYVVHTVPVVRREDARPRLRVGGKTGHRPDLGPEAEPRPRRLEAEPLQPHLRRLHRQGPPAAGHRGDDPRGQAAPHRPGRPAAGGRVVRAVPAPGDRRHDDARPAPAARQGDR